MCIIIAKKAGVKRLDSAYFERAWNRNPDGGGLVWKKPNEQVYIQKGFMNKEAFLKKIDELNQDDTAFIAHFRIKSVGAVCAENTHPFNMGKVTFAHNGTLSIEPFEGKTDSETFGLCFLKDKGMNWIKRYQTLLEMALHTSKFAIMDNQTGEILVLNEDLGKERDGAWFSNESAFAPVVPAHPVTYSGANYGYDRYGQQYWTTGKGGTVHANATFGTKRFVRPYGKLNDKKIWTYEASGKTVLAYGYDNVALSKRGFYVINPDVQVPDEAENKKYDSKSVEVKYLDKLTKEFYKLVVDYHKQTFADIEAREEAENELSAQYTILDAMRRFIRAGKVIDDKEFLSFCLDNTESASWMTKWYTAYTYGEYVGLYVNDVLKGLEDAYAAQA